MATSDSMNPAAESARRAALEAALAEARARSGAPGTAPEGAPLRERIKNALANIPFRRRVLTAVLSAVAIPAVILAGLAIYLTQRVTRSVETDSATYDSYVGQQVAEAFELELNSHLRAALEPVDPAIRAGADPGLALAAVPMNGDGFAGWHFVPVSEVEGLSVLLVESQVLAYAPGEGHRRGQYFVGWLLRNGTNDIIGAGGWWVDPGVFIQRHLDEVVQEKIPADERIYGGIESIRHVSIEVFGPGGERVGAVREPADLKTARMERLSGPFERYVVRVAPTSSAGAAWTLRFISLEIFIITLMGLVILAAMLFGYRYTVRQLELAQMKASFVSNVTHELKTPIALIRLAVETLQMRRFNSPDESERFLSTIERETQKLTRLVDNILDLARFESGHHILKMTQVDVRQIAQETLENFRPRLEHAGFRVETDLPDGLPRVRGDAIALSHCLLNLLDNAVKYSKDDRYIRVTAAASNGTVQLSVADHGIGVAPGDRRRIFEKFVRIDHGLQHDAKGAGLGLSLVQQIMRAHHGRVEVTPNPGGGSVFTLVLPATDGADAARAHDRAPVSS
ncbi:MAG TPA: HAMP domain-containing sensor histidine kinase [Candidatus Sulfotelmatobacter sp.]|nr:HAMP domain-containing sensor histidine kinase [Candidatus Sulfotelmatobacter sp.]